MDDDDLRLLQASIGYPPQTHPEPDAPAPAIVEAPNSSSFDNILAGADKDDLENILAQLADVEETDPTVSPAPVSIEPIQNVQTAQTSQPAEGPQLQLDLQEVSPAIIAILFNTLSTTNNDRTDIDRKELLIERLYAYVDGPGETQATLPVPNHSGNQAQFRTQAASAQNLLRTEYQRQAAESAKDPEKRAEQERIRSENRDRKKKWREHNQDRNKDNDLRCRVQKRAIKIYREPNPPTISIEDWKAIEFTKRKQRRLVKEANAKEQGNDGANGKYTTTQLKAANNSGPGDLQSAVPAEMEHVVDIIMNAPPELLAGLRQLAQEIAGTSANQSPPAPQQFTYAPQATYAQPMYPPEPAYAPQPSYPPQPYNVQPENQQMVAHAPMANISNPIPFPSPPAPTHVIPVAPIATAPEPEQPQLTTADVTGFGGGIALPEGFDLLLKDLEAVRQTQSPTPELAQSSREQSSVRELTPTFEAAPPKTPRTTPEPANLLSMECDFDENTLDALLDATMTPAHNTREQTPVNVEEPSLLVDDRRLQDLSQEELNSLLDHCDIDSSPESSREPTPQESEHDQKKELLLAAGLTHEDLAGLGPEEYDETLALLQSDQWQVPPMQPPASIQSAPIGNFSRLNHEHLQAAPGVINALFAIAGPPQQHQQHQQQQQQQQQRMAAVPPRQAQPFPYIQQPPQSTPAYHPPTVSPAKQAQIITPKPPPYIAPKGKVTTPQALISAPSSLKRKISSDEEAKKVSSFGFPPLYGGMGNKRQRVSPPAAPAMATTHAAMSV